MSKPQPRLACGASWLLAARLTLLEKNLAMSREELHSNYPGLRRQGRMTQDGGYQHVLKGLGPGGTPG